MRTELMKVEISLPPEIKAELQSRADAAGLEFASYMQIVIQAGSGLKWDIKTRKKRNPKV